VPSGYARWRDIDFCVNPYKEVKDMYTLGALDEVLQALEDSQVTLSTILASRYVAGIRWALFVWGQPFFQLAGLHSLPATCVGMRRL
jgi:Dynein heavy chain, N-terminal region 2